MEEDLTEARSSLICSPTAAAAAITAQLVCIHFKHVFLLPVYNDVLYTKYCMNFKSSDIIMIFSHLQFRNKNTGSHESGYKYQKRGKTETLSVNIGSFLTCSLVWPVN